MTWSESVDQALSFGWIDGVRKRVDDLRYTIRFTPRRWGSIWSAVNIKRVRELSDKGLMKPPGMAAFDARKENRSGIYSYEQRSANLDEPYEKRLRQNEAAWDFFYAQPPSKSSRLVGSECKAGRNAAEAAAKADRGIGEPEAPVLVTKRQTNSAFLNRQADEPQRAHSKCDVRWATATGLYRERMSWLRILGKPRSSARGVTHTGAKGPWE